MGAAFRFLGSTTTTGMIFMGSQRNRSCAAGLLWAMGLVPAVFADVRLPAIVGDRMVLQQNSEVGVWGWASPGEKVSVRGSWGGSSAEAVTDESGKWRSKLRTPKAGGPFEVTVAGKNTLTLKDVLIGEVWVCSGQSNMEWSLAQAKGGAEAVAAATHADLRLFMVKNTVAARPGDDCVAEGPGWQECTPASAARFSAVGYFFAREIQASIGVPIGLVSADWGGTPAEAWTSERALRQFPEFGPRLDAIAALSADPNERLKKVEEVGKKWWDAIDTHADAPGAGWAAPSFNDSAWKTMGLPQTMVQDGLESFDGIVYFRHSFDLGPGFEEGTVLSLGPIDDMDDAYINGVLVGSTHEEGKWDTGRRYVVPDGLLKPGLVTIAVRVYDHSGPGGFTGKRGGLNLHLAILDTKSPKIERGKPYRVPLDGPWKYKVGPARSAMAPRPGAVTVDANTPTALYNGMIAPIVPYGIKGAIWYQGESNRGEWARYRTLFPAMIRNWREDWGRGDFPFYFVQIAPFKYGGDRGETAGVREAQLMTLRESASLPNTGMAVTMDIGDPKDIHPAEKREVGRRLALWALAKDYGKTGLAHSGPVFRSSEVKGGAVRVKFEHAKSGLLVKGDRLTHVLIAGADRKFHDAEVKVEGDVLVVSSPAVEVPVAVRYGWDDACEPNLFNNDGLPASPFRTDDWPVATER